MEKNQIKKLLYSEKPTAYLNSVRKDGILYTVPSYGTNISFLVPLNEIGEVIWKLQMEAHLLIRYLL